MKYYGSTVDPKDMVNKEYVDGKIEEILDQYLDPTNWYYIRGVVRAGRAPMLFPVGYEFHTIDADTGNALTWVVGGHNHHTPADEKLTHSMTLMLKNVYSQSNGSAKGFISDAPEAMYYAEKELPAGTYHFTWDQERGSVVKGTYQFTIEKAVPAGGQIVLGTNGSSVSIAACKISTHAAVGDVATIESNIGISEGSGGTDLGTMFASASSDENLNCCNRVMLGSNNYAQSAVRQWMNSAAAAGSVWKPTNKFDRSPSWAATYDGFMHGLPRDFLDAVQEATFPCHTNSYFEVDSLDGTAFEPNTVYNLSDKFFLLSRPEVYGTYDSTAYKDGEMLEYYAGLSDTERIKYDITGTSRSCWLRSSRLTDPSYYSLIAGSGSWNINYAGTSQPISISCIIA